MREATTPTPMPCTAMNGSRSCAGTCVRWLGSVPVSSSGARMMSDGYVTSMATLSGSSPARRIPRVYPPHSRLALSSSAIPVRGEVPTVPSPMTSRTMPRRIRLRPGHWVAVTRSRNSRAPTSTTDSGVVPATRALTCAADVLAPPAAAIRKNGRPAPAVIIRAACGGTRRSAGRREGSSGSSSVAGIRKRISATSPGVSGECPMARMVSANAAQISTVTASAAQPSSAPAGRPRPAARGNEGFSWLTLASSGNGWVPPRNGQKLPKPALTGGVRGRICQNPPMDDRDRRILAALQANGRISNQDLADQVHLSPSPCLRRVRQLEDSGVIQGYTALVDEEAYGLTVTAFVRVRLQLHTTASIRAFEDAIARMDAVLDCYVMTGEADYLLRVLVADLKAYEAFVRRELHAVPGIASIDTSFAYGRVKRATVYPQLG
ncbi:hypothetical protein DEGR_06880 [Deinococcus grandis]|nr:hypothetical protein DEGR_06880 [Deinococcus grandis]